MLLFKYLQYLPTLPLCLTVFAWVFVGNRHCPGPSRIFLGTLQRKRPVDSSLLTSNRNRR